MPPAPIRPALFLTIPLTLSLCLAACDSDSIFAEPQQQLVVEGWIDDGGAPIVIPTLTLPVNTEPHSFSELKDNILRWARVSITDGTDTVILRGHYNEGFFPPYIYTDDNFCGRAGGTYTIWVDYRQYHATATTTIPRTVRPDSICLTTIAEDTASVSRSAAGGDKGYQAMVYFKDPPDEKNYYALFARCGSADRHYRLSPFGTLDDADFNRGDNIKAHIYRPTSFRESYNRFFQAGDTIGVKFATVDAQSYDVLSDFSRASAIASTAFITSMFNIRSNIEGGLGYWVGCGSTFAYFIAPPERKNAKK